MAILEIHPDYRVLLETFGLATFDALFEAGEGNRVDGHDLRSVSRLQVDEGDRKVVIYVKRRWGKAATASWHDLVRLRFPMLPVHYEWKSALQLLKANIPVSRPVAWGVCADAASPRALIAFREVEGPSLAEWIHRSASKEPSGRLARSRHAVATTLGQTVRRLHDAGFSFPDLYTKHLYLEHSDGPAPRVVLIDVQRLRALLPWRRVKDLAALYVSAQVPGVTRTDRLRVLRAYFRGRRVTSRRARALMARIERAAARMPGRGRDPNLIDARRTAPPGVVPLADEHMTDVDDGRLRVNKAFRPMLEAAGLTTLDAIMDLEGGQMFRLRPGRSTVRLELADPAGGKRTVYVKRHTGVPFRTKLRRTLSLNPPISFAKHETRGIVRLADIGIASMRRVAVGEQVTHGGRRERSCIITEDIAGATQADDYFQANFSGKLSAEQVAAKRRLVLQMADLARRLHRARLSHRDFYLCHIMVRPVAGAEPVLHLIDLQRLAHHRRGIGQRWVVKDLAALLFSSWPSPATGIRSPVFGQTDRLRFARAYFEVGRLTEAHKRLLRKVVAKARRIARHEARRRARRRARP